MFRLCAPLALLAACGPMLASAAGPPLAGQEAEDFLRTAKVVDMEEVGIGVTAPQRVTLRAGERTARAIWKTVDVYEPVKRFDDGGPPEIGFRDTYKHEIAAYELDKLLGLGMVPPTVERRIGRRRGSLQFWLEGMTSEAERVRKGIAPPDEGRWNEQMYVVRLWHQLIDDRDFNNINNLLFDADFRLFIIDSSRAFRLAEELREPEILDRLPRRLLAKLRQLDVEQLRKRLGRWLTKDQIRALLVRRDLILERADELIAAHGEAAVLFP